MNGLGWSASEPRRANRRHVSGTQPVCLGLGGQERQDSALIPHLLSDLFSPRCILGVLKAERCRLSPGSLGCDSRLRAHVSLCLQENTPLISPWEWGSCSDLGFVLSVSTFLPTAWNGHEKAAALTCSRHSWEGYQYEMMGLMI